MDVAKMDLVFKTNPIEVRQLDSTPDTMTHYKYYPCFDVIMRDNSKTERLHKAMRLLEPELFDVSILRSISANGKRLTDEGYVKSMTMGMMCLYNEKTLVAVAFLSFNKIDRIITLPLFRRKGHAVRLIHEVERRMAVCGMYAFSPVKKEVEPVVLKAGWVKANTEASDGTCDFCPPSAMERYGRGNGLDAIPWFKHLHTLI